MKIPVDAKLGFLVTVGVLAALVAYNFLVKRVPQLAT